MEQVSMSSVHGVNAEAAARFREDPDVRAEYSTVGDYIADMELLESGDVVMAFEDKVKAYQDRNGTTPGVALAAVARACPAAHRLYVGEISKEKNQTRSEQDPPAGVLAQTFKTLVDKHVAEKKCSRTEAIAAVSEENQKLHAAYLKESNEGS